MAFEEATLGADETSGTFLIIGNCDIWVSGLTSGTVKLQLLFPRKTTWLDVPDGTYTDDTMKTIFISEDGVRCRLVGVSNNAGVYVRMGRFLND